MQIAVSLRVSLCDSVMPTAVEHNLKDSIQESDRACQLACLIANHAAGISAFHMNMCGTRYTCVSRQSTASTYKYLHLPSTFAEILGHTLVLGRAHAVRPSVAHHSKRSPGRSAWFGKFWDCG